MSRMATAEPLTSSRKKHRILNPRILRRPHNRAQAAH
jgi:hypothetical protein